MSIHSDQERMKLLPLLFRFTQKLPFHLHLYNVRLATLSYAMLSMQLSIVLNCNSNSNFKG